MSNPFYKLSYENPARRITPKIHIAFTGSFVYVSQKDIPLESAYQPEIQAKGR
jgi:hypothetical protein